VCKKSIKKFIAIVNEATWWCKWVHAKANKQRTISSNRIEIIFESNRIVFFSAESPSTTRYQFAPYLPGASWSTRGASWLVEQVDIGASWLSRVHTCHKMAPLNGTILWRHKIARLDVTKHRTGRTVRTGAKYRSWVLVKCVWCCTYYWFRLRTGTGYGFHAFLTSILLLLLLIQCNISLYWGPVRTVRCFVTPCPSGIGKWRHFLPEQFYCSI